MKIQQAQALIIDIRFAIIVVISVARREDARSTHVPSMEAKKRTERLIVIPLEKVSLGRRHALSEKNWNYLGHGLQHSIDEATKLPGKADAVNRTAANSYVRAFHVESRWHRYKVYATFLVTTSGCILP
jgi:hypothetical protein